MPCLSTPHGTLGTPHTQKEKPSNQQPFNSTRYIRNEGEGICKGIPKGLSTPHGTLGTHHIRVLSVAEIVFQLHTVH